MYVYVERKVIDVNKLFNNEYNPYHTMSVKWHISCIWAVLVSINSTSGSFVGSCIVWRIQFYIPDAVKLIENKR